MGFSLENVVPWGRVFAEYQAMFALSDADLQRRILGCADGPASFNAEATLQGYNIISCDPLYAASPAAIQKRVNKTFETVIIQLESNQDEFVWEHFANPTQLGETRMQALEGFLADFPTGKAVGRYRVMSLPELDFRDNHFDLALCSHFLFLYSEQFSLDFHVMAIEELCRVAPEVRIFPLLQLGSTPSPHLEPAIQVLIAKGYRATVEQVDYEFQRGGNQMLRLRCKH